MIVKSSKASPKKEKEIKKPGEKTKELEDSRVALMNILEDVEEARKQAEEEKNKTLSIINNFVDGLLSFDKNTILSLFNPQAEKFFDVKARDLIGRPLSELETFPTLRPLVKLFGGELKKIFRQEISIKEDLVLEVSVISVIEKEYVSGHLVILHDISREKKIEKMKTEFVSLAAHQLRTPLSAIKWTLRMILDGDVGATSQAQKDLLEKTYRSNERMIALINDLLDVTRIEEGRYLFKPVLSDIGAIAQFVVNSYQEEAKRKNIKLELIRTEEGLPKLIVDVEKMRLALQNVIDNAVKYTPKDGNISVAVNGDKKEIKISVKDTGVGIPEDQQGRLFTKFFRGANVVRLDTEGSGLGLFIAKNIIEAHGGKIWFESAGNKGTTFYLTLPVKGEFTEFLKEF